MAKEDFTSPAVKSNRTTRKMMNIIQRSSLCGTIYPSRLYSLNNQDGKCWSGLIWSEQAERKYAPSG